ncbi:MAG TPA: N-acetylmuramidase domain-containing protein [Noviherbaspirillum sp.]|uniref:LysM peptidoglycan-binding domain-containing protein n=1 Tax=Noviherbaspirillum sp. TaxID=1926288 RepID=UPI002B466DF2|nr:N-acetylmuramidase domain-containing protein [Noviherbaspirillum sp.]HJV87497.1 N-acetylmuramidase domain-containing protein [Noviherbaspirillum sp.]
MSDFYVVKKGDTLARIARDHGTTISELRKLNDLRNPNKLDVGQRIALRKDAVCGLEALFLDADRNAIKGLEYVLEFCGKSIRGTTDEYGKAQKILTDWPTDQVRVLVKRFDGTLKDIGTVISGYRNKLVTLISPLLVVDTELKPHPPRQADHHPDTKKPIKPAYDKNNPAKPTTDKKELGPEVKHPRAKNGEAVTVVEGDVPGLDEFLDKFVGGDITTADLNAAAKELGCEPGLIYAIAKQESAISSFFKLGERTVPKILFERHKFREYARGNTKTLSPFEKLYPDICGPAYVRARKNKNGEWIKNLSGVIVTENDVYGPSGAFQYKRLCKAYQLNRAAALQACSWGKFQIMGFNYKMAGFNDVISFTKAMSRSDAEHIKAFLKFAASNKTLADGLRTKSFEKIAAGHNGDNWRQINPEYATNIERFYREYNQKNNG